MFGLSLRTFRERWQLFIGAMLTVAMGVALVQSALLILISAASPVIPAGLTPGQRQQVEDGYTGAITLLGMVLALATFLAVFIVGSTFAFTVAQRRRDLALLRLVGGSRGQLRRLLLSEASLLAVLGCGIGIPLGLVAMRIQSNLLRGLGFLPSQFTARWQDWILAVSFGVGIGVALAGVYAAARRAAKVAPLEALRATGAQQRVMTAVRWLFGLIFLAGAIALMVLAPLVGTDGAIPMSINVSITAAVALAALSPLAVPLVGRLLGLVLRWTTLGGLAQANLRDGVRRSASTAAPLLVLVALVIGLSGSLSTLAVAGRADLQRSVQGDLVVDSSGVAAERIAGAPGVAVAATQVEVGTTVVTGSEKHDKEDVETQDTVALAVDPAAYRSTHPLPLAAGSLAGLHGRTMVVGQGEDLSLGDTATVRIGDRNLALRVVGVLPETVNGGDDYLLPRDLVPASSLAGPAQTVVRFARGADRAAVTRAIEADGGRVRTMSAWLAANTSEQDKMNSGIMTVLMGLAGLYALVAVINAVVIAAADRKAEFATARVTGLDRGQVVRTALVEAGAVTTIGLLLGFLGAAGTLIGIGSAVSRFTGHAEFDVPWGPLALVGVGAFVVVGLTSVWTSLAATRTAPVRLVGARE
ncbi:MAG TPA: FtsX-like permease family protein [Pseudonocardiaceae bacterium]|jgi:putative ABC transport system permease protein|nr:FtsX-like permease family protein [Pseudonocardiaceae bacterium]